jgi:broad specificity phosphatase PhoE
MTARLQLLCHAPTAATRKSGFPADEPLEPKARERLAQLPHRLNNADVRLTSPALRAVQTAIALGIEATVVPLLRECDYGRWTGRSFDEVQAEEPAAIAEWLTNPAASPHGGESILALMERVAGWLKTRQPEDAKTIAVTHASVIRAAIVLAIEAEPRSFWRIDIAPLSLARLHGAMGRWTLASVGPMAAMRRETQDE